MARCDAFVELDDEVTQEFYSDVKDCIRDVNESCAALETEEPSRLVNRMFRAIHTVKGNCNMVQLHSYVDAIHYIEEMVQDVRNGHYDFEPAYANLFATSMNAIAEMLVETLGDGHYDENTLSLMTALIKEVRESEDSIRPNAALCAVTAISDGHYTLSLVAAAEEDGHVFSIFEATDLEYFQYLSDCHTHVEPEHQGRMRHLIEFSVTLNESLGSPCDQEQLMAAIYSYEIARIFVRSSDESNQEQNKRRIFVAGGLLSHMSGWKIAADYVYQSKERVDGQGIPRQLQAQQIEVGAQIVQLTNHFIDTALTNKQEGYKKSLFVAVKRVNQEVNGAYAPDIINTFNQIIRQHYLVNTSW